MKQRRTFAGFTIAVCLLASACTMLRRKSPLNWSMILQIDQSYQILFSLTKNGADKFGAWTGANVNEYIAVVVNDTVRSTAFIRSQISDQGQINGNFTKSAAEDLALVLRSGSLPFPVKFVSETSTQIK